MVMSTCIHRMIICTNVGSGRRMSRSLILIMSGISWVKNNWCMYAICISVHTVSEYTHQCIHISDQCTVNKGVHIRRGVESCFPDASWYYIDLSGTTNYCAVYTQFDTGKSTVLFCRAKWKQSLINNCAEPSEKYHWKVTSVYYIKLLVSGLTFMNCQSCLCDWTQSCYLPLCCFVSCKQSILSSRLDSQSRNVNCRSMRF